MNVGVILILIGTAILAGVLFWANERDKFRK